MQILPTNKASQLIKGLEIFQICDSTFPIGTFNHSYGMENYLVTDIITNAPTFEAWLKAFLTTQFTYGEGLVIQLVDTALKADQLEKVWQYDREITLASVAKETREAGKMIAHRMIELVLDLHVSPLLTKYQQAILTGKAYGNPAIVFALFMFEKGADVADSINYYGYSIVSTTVQNAVRAVPLGQRDGQLILKRSFSILASAVDRILDLSESFLGASVPGIELAQMNHETQMFRLFMS